MTAPDAQDLRWENGVPVSGRFDDPYYSREDGLAETRHVFLEGCRVAERLRDGFSIAELGFGTGLNFCATLAQWQAHGPAEGTCEYTAFEMYPMQAAELDRALAVWPELDAQRAAWMRRIADAQDNWRGEAVLTPLPRPDAEWLSPDAAPFGAMHSPFRKLGVTDEDSNC